VNSTAVHDVRVFISSSGDLRPERSALKDLFNELNVEFLARPTGWTAQLLAGAVCSTRWSGQLLAASGPISSRQTTELPSGAHVWSVSIVPFSVRTRDRPARQTNPPACASAVRERATCSKAARSWAVSAWICSRLPMLTRHLLLRDASAWHSLAGCTT
jgi:hypothetical protein